MELIRRFSITTEHTTGNPTGRVKFSRDGSRLLAMNRYQVASYNINGTIEGKAIVAIPVFDAAYISHRHVVISTTNPESECQLVICDLQTQRRLISLETGQILSVCVDYERRRIYAGQVGGDVIVYDFSLNEQSRFQVQGMAMGLTLSHSGDKLAMEGVFFELWDIAGTPQRISEECPVRDDCTGTPCEANSVDMTPDGRYVVGGFHGAQGLFALMDGESGKILRWYGPRGDEMNFYATQGIAISSNGKYVAHGQAETELIRILRLDDGSVVDRIYPDEPCDVAFSPVGNMLALAGESTIRLYSSEEWG